MSTNTAARRIALLSSTSLGLAAIVSAASLGVALAPTTAAAQATCVSGTAVNNNVTNNVTIAGGTNNPGITCAYVGDNALVSTLAATTVSTTAPGGGINLTAAGTDDINWNSTAGTVTGGAQTNGPVIDAQTSGAGNITLTTANVTQSTSAGAGGIYARSAGAGDIVVTTGAVGFASNSSNPNFAIHTQTAGGDIAITTNGAVGSQVGNVTLNAVNRDGIVATTSGAGEVTLDLRNSVFGSGPGGAAIRITNGAGDVIIGTTGQLTGGGTSTVPGAASAVVVQSGGDIVLNSTGLIRGAQTDGGAAAIVASGQTFTLNLTGNASVASIGNYTASLGGVAGGTGGLLAQMNPNTGGHVDFSGITGSVEINLATKARWAVSGVSVMSAGHDVVNIDESSVMLTPQVPGGGGLNLQPGDHMSAPNVIDFGPGGGEVNNLGLILVGPVRRNNNPADSLSPDDRMGVRAELRLENLTAFTNSGDIYLGARFGNHSSLGTSGDVLRGSDQWADDILSMPGATFHGGEGSRLFIDANLSSAGQSSCNAAARDADGWLAVDCVNLAGATSKATGRTEVILTDLIPGDRGAYIPEGNVIVDLAGSDPSQTDPQAFVMSPETAGYTAEIGSGAMDKGLFFYTIGYDAETQQFKLYGLPGAGAQQFPLLAHAANQLWRTATGGWFERRVDQRDVEREPGIGSGAWFNVSHGSSERDVVTTVAIGSSEADFNNSYNQDDAAVTFGWDMIGVRDAGMSWTLGGMVGYARAEVDYDTSPNTANLEGMHAGLYGGVTVGDFFVDGAVNQAWLKFDNDIPALDLFPDTAILGTDIESRGVELEAGWRWRADNLSVEPLAGLSYVSTSFGEIRVPNDDPDVNRPGGVVSFEDTISRRGSLGVRLGLDDLVSDVAPTRLSLTAKAVKEFDGEAAVSIANTGPTAAPVFDTLDGTFVHLIGSLSVSNPSRTLSGDVSVDALTGDDYSRFGVSFGLRYQW